MRPAESFCNAVKYIGFDIYLCDKSKLQMDGKPKTSSGLFINKY